MVEVSLNIQDRLKYLSEPKPSFSANEMLVSCLLRSLEMKEYLSSSEKVIDDSELVKSYVGKRVVFIADIGRFLDITDADTGKEVPYSELGYVTLVGEDIGGSSVPVNLSISSYVAESLYLDLSEVDFKGNYKLLDGMTLMFSANINLIGGLVQLSEVSILEAGLRLFNPDGSVYALAVFSDKTKTYNLEHFLVEDGVLVRNNYRNPLLDSYFEEFKATKDKKHLSVGGVQVVKTFDKAYGFGDDVLNSLVTVRKVL